MTGYLKFGEWLRTTRHQRSLTQKQLAERIGAAPKTVQRWEKGNKLPGAYYLLRLKESFPFMPDTFSPPTDEQTPIKEEQPSTLIRQPPPVHRRLFQAPSLPKEYVHRPDVFDKIKHLLLTQEGQQTTALTTALRGVGGFGKTTLAIALCHDPDIQVAFPDGILWVELGEQPPRPLDVLNGKLREMDKTFSGALTLEEARGRWFMALHESVYLLVIDDVWKIETLKELLQGGPRCKRLVTTRNDLLLPKEIPSQARVVVDAMKHSEAITLLCQDLPKEVFRATYQPKLKALTKRLGFWPLLLTLANGMLTDLVEHHLSIAQALTTLTEAYEALGVTAFRMDNVEERQQTVDACLGVSLRHLETFTQPHYHATQRYQELAVFPEDTDIPLSTLQIYWKGNAGLQPWATKDLCLRLHHLSLLLNCDLGAGTIRLHDVVRSYLIQRTREHLPALHQHLLNAYQQHYYLTSWANLPRSESYLWQHLVSHLCQINHPEMLQTTLIDLLYLARKTLYRGVPELEADLGLASTFSLSTGVGNVSSQLTVLHRTTMRISHFLQQVSSEAEIGSLLLSYLGEHTGWTTPQGALEQELPRPFLAAWHPLPQSPSSALHRTLRGHVDSVNACRFSPNGKFIASASADGTLKVWEVATGAEHLTLSGHTDPVNGCAFSSDGEFVISASADNTLRVWEAATGAEILTLAGHTSWINACTFSPDGKFIISASRDHTLKVWEATTGAEISTLAGHTKPVNDCAFSPDGKFIVSASDDHTLKVWDATTGAEILTLAGHTEPVHGCTFSPDGKFIASASWDQTLKVWDATTGAEILTLAGHTEPVHDCTFSPDGKFIVSASADHTLRVWDAATGAERRILSGHTKMVHGCTFSPDGKFIASASRDHTLKVWDATTGTEILTLSGHTKPVNDCAFSLDGKFIVSASDDHTLKVWEMRTGRDVLTFPVDGALLGCVFHPDGEHLIVCGDTGMYFLRLVQ